MSDRYSRQVLFSGIGESGQARLRSSSVLVVGCGALGSLQCELLVRAGIGRLRVVDRDFVEESNLQRQTLFTERDAADGTPKAIAAADRLRQVSSDVEIEPVVADVDASRIRRLAEGVALIVDGTDNFDTRLLINDLSVASRLPWIYGAAVGSYGVTMTVLPDGPCLRCVLEVVPAPGAVDTCDTAGVIAPVVTTIASLQVAEALKILVGRPELACSDVRSIDVWSGGFQQIAADRRPDCPVCGQGRFDHLDGQVRTAAEELCGRDAVQVRPPAGAAALDLAALGRRLETVARTRVHPHLLRVWVDGAVLSVFRDGRAIVSGVDDPARARALYARYVGG